MDWYRQGTKPLPEPMLTQICVTIMSSPGRNELKLDALRLKTIWLEFCKPYFHMCLPDWKMSEFLFIQFHWNLFFRVHLAIIWHEFRWPLLTNHYLNQWWPSSMTHIPSTNVLNWVRFRIYDVLHFSLFVNTEYGTRSWKSFLKEDKVLTFQGGGWKHHNTNTYHQKNYKNLSRQNIGRK